MIDKYDALLERMKKEKVYESLDKAIEEAIQIHLVGKEQLIIVKNAVGQYVTVHDYNWEISELMGFKLIIGFSQLSYISHMRIELNDVYKLIELEV